jgi:hypothetical protein
MPRYLIPFIPDSGWRFDLKKTSLIIIIRIVHEKRSDYPGKMPFPRTQKLLAVGTRKMRPSVEVIQ